MKALHCTAFTLMIVGALNWGLIGLGGFVGADWNVVKMILGSWPTVEWLVYLLVGVSAVVLMFSHKGDCRMCNTSGM